MRSADVSDATLVARVRAGDPHAFPAIYTRHAPAVREIVRARLGNQGDPADAVQDVFVAAWTGIDRLHDPDRLRPWLAQIARRTAIDHGRRARRTSVEGHDALGHLIDLHPGPEDEACARDLARRLAAGMRTLGAREAAALMIADRGPAAIAVALGVTEGNAKVIVHRARRRLRVAAAA